MRRYAVIDMGSNSFRLVVYGYEQGAWWAPVDEIRESTRVSAGIGPDGALLAEPMDRAVHTAAVFASFLRAAEVERVDAVATSAIRDATNRDELLERISRATGLEVRVVSGAEEAWYGYLAIVNSTTLTDGFGIDIGGGSVQLMRIGDRRLGDAESLPLGAVRTSEAFLAGESTSAKQLKRLRKHVARELSQLDWWETGDGFRLAGLGGTVRNLATAIQRRRGLEHIDVQGWRLARDDLEDLIDALAAMPASERRSVRGIKPDRGDVILGGAATLATIMAEGGFDELEVTGAGLREGVFLEHLLAGSDPPLVGDVRRDAVLGLGRRFATDDAHVEQVARLSLALFDGLAEAALHRFGDPERELLWAACRLHDIGVAIDYDDHHRHSQYLIEHAGLAGFDPRELALIALIARWHRKGQPDVAELGALARAGDDRRLTLLSAIVRTAEQLERSRDGVVRDLRLSVSEGTLELVAAVAPGSDPVVARWAAQRSSGLLGEAVGREVRVSTE